MAGGRELVSSAHAAFSAGHCLSGRHYLSFLPGGRLLVHGYAQAVVCCFPRGPCFGLELIARSMEVWVNVPAYLEAVA
jgi:hypothetical protein